MRRRSPRLADSYTCLLSSPAPRCDAGTSPRIVIASLLAECQRDAFEKHGLPQTHSWHLRRQPAPRAGAAKGVPS